MEDTSIISGVIGGLTTVLIKKLKQWAVQRKLKGVEAYIFGITSMLLPFTLSLIIFNLDGKLNLNFIFIFSLVLIFFGILLGRGITDKVETNEI